MALHINKLKDFEEKLHTDPIRITKTKDIVSNIMATLNEIPVTERTVYKKLSQFKNSIYYCSSNLGNPMFLSNACNTLNLTEEVVYIYERMFAFLYGNGFLNFERLETLYSKYKPNSFSWNIPEIFLPIAISYILAVTSFKKCDSPKKFFDKMDDYFKSFKNTPQITKEIYKDWTDLYLGREYFCHLENIYETFTKTAKQKEIVKISLRPLTRLFVESPIEPNSFPLKASKFLTMYEALLKERDSSTLFPHDRPTIPEDETCLIGLLSGTLFHLHDDLLDFCRMSLNRNSTYKISVNNFNLFNNDFDNYTATIDTQIEKSLEQIKTAYDTIKNKLNKDYTNYNATVIEEHCDFLISSITTYKDKLIQEFSAFIRKVKWASEPNPENRSSLRVGTDYFNVFENSLYDIAKNLEKKFNKDFKKLPPFLIHKEGYIMEQLRLSTPLEPWQKTVSEFFPNQP